MQELCEDLGEVTDSMCSRSPLESFPPARASSRSRISSTSARSEAIVGTTSSDACQARNRSASSATSRSARAASLRRPESVSVNDGLEVVDVVEEAAVEVVDRGIEIAWDREVDEQERPALPRPERRRHGRAVEDELAALVAETTTSARSSSTATLSSAIALGAQLARQILAVRERSVRDDRDLGTAGDEVPGRRLAHLSGARAAGRDGP